MADLFEFVSTLFAWIHSPHLYSVSLLELLDFLLFLIFLLVAGGKATRTSGANEGDYTKKVLESLLFFQEISNNFVCLILLVGALCVISSHQEDLDYHSFP